MDHFTFPTNNHQYPNFLKVTDIDFLLSTSEGRFLLLTQMNGLIRYPEAEHILSYIASKLDDFDDKEFIKELQQYIDSLYKTSKN